MTEAIGGDDGTGRMTLDIAMPRDWNMPGSARPDAGSHPGAWPAAAVRISMEQSELVELARGGDQQAFARLIEAVSDRLYAVAWRIVHDPDRAQDAMQRTLIAVWDDLPQLRDPDRFDAWAYRILVREAIREARAERHQVIVHDISPSGRLDPGPADEIAARDEIEHGFRGLSAEHRAVLALRFYLDLPVAKIAEILHVPEGTVDSRIHYALRNLRAALDAEARPTDAWRRAG